MAKNPKEGEKTQRQRFIETAREIGADDDENAFREKLKRIAKAPVSEKKDKPAKGK